MKVRRTLKPLPVDDESGQNIILDSIADGVFTVDQDWRITSFNRAAERITGVTRSEAVNQLCKNVLKADICERTGLQSAEASTLCVQGELNLALGKAAEAEDCYRKARAIFEKLGTRYSLAEALFAGGLALGNSDRGRAEAEHWMAQAKSLFYELNLPHRAEACIL